MNSFICIVGPTCSGKTSLALKLHDLLPSILISADSRQVYRGMDIVTGKDHPDAVTLHGIDLVDPDEECSVAIWYQAALPVIKQAWDSNLVPIIVGGTGLYFRALTNGIDTMRIPPDQNLRDSLASLSVLELQSRLRKLNIDKLNSMNQSDILNPRRLIRAIEIASSSLKVTGHKSQVNSLLVGLKPKDFTGYEAKVRQRVMDRLELGAIEETKALLGKYSPSLPAFTSLGYPHIISYLHGKLSIEDLITSWTQEELQYSKRQLTWFNKVEGVNWFDPQSPTIFTEVASLAKDWYSK